MYKNKNNKSWVRDPKTGEWISYDSKWIGINGTRYFDEKGNELLYISKD